MTTAQDKMAQAGEKLSGQADQLKDINAVYKFVLDGDGGGTWVMDLRNGATVTEGDADAQCTIKMTAPDFVDMVEGRANPQADTSKWEQEIDTLVYQLYGLTEDEVKIVEGKK